MDLDAAHTLKIDEYITSNEKVLDKNDPQGKVAFYVDEWGTWYSTEPGREPGFLYQQNRLRDALVAALNFHVFHSTPSACRWPTSRRWSTCCRP